MHRFGPLLPVEEAQARVLAVVRPVRAAETVPLESALGRSAASTVRAPRPVPSFARATWDGYALRSADTLGAGATSPTTLRIVGEIFAEDRLGRALRAGECVAIATGGCLPRGADTVEIFEDVEADGEAIRLRRPVRPGARIAEVGEDYARGAVVVADGEVLTPASLGGLSSIGRNTVRVRRRPVVAILPNGNELVAPGRRLARGSIYESNNRTLGAVVRAGGGDPRPLRPVPDDPARIESALRAALRRSDAVLVTGGSSVGERDFLPRIFPKVGRLLFHGIAVRPGKPTLAAEVGGRLLLGMPGHPTSCLANAYWLLLPALRRLASLPGPGWIEGSAVLTRSAGALTPGLTTVVPLRVEDGQATPTFHDSSAITSLARVNAFALLPPGTGEVPAGERLAIRWLPPPIGAPSPG